MKEHSSTRIAIVTAIAVAILLALWWMMGYYWNNQRYAVNLEEDVYIVTMELQSSAFAHEGVIPSRYTCDGDGMSPPLEVSGVPSEAKSLMLVVEDPDVPTTIREDGMWDHWIVWNIDPSANIVHEGVEPDGIHGLTTSSTLEYVPPCPPDAEHRYFFFVYALDTNLALSEGATKEDALEAAQGHVIGMSELMGRYTRDVQ